MGKDDFKCLNQLDLVKQKGFYTCKYTLKSLKKNCQAKKVSSLKNKEINDEVY